jgi:hypothetical protein
VLGALPPEGGRKRRYSMHPERNDEVYARELAVDLRADPRPRCPQLRVCHTKRLYPVEGYCVLVESSGQFMIPSIEEYRASCTTARFVDCCWFRGTGAGLGSVETHPTERPVRAELWLPSDVLQPTLGDMM